MINFNDALESGKAVFIENDNTLHIVVGCGDKVFLVSLCGETKQVRRENIVGIYQLMRTYSTHDKNKHEFNYECTYQKLWERQKPKKMTHSEIEKELGYKVKIVNEDV